MGRSAYVGPAHDPGVGALIARSDGSAPDLARDILWVYANVQNARVRATDAPSCGAWGMLKWVRVSPSRFFEQLLPKAKVLQEKQAAEAKDADSALKNDVSYAQLHRELQEMGNGWDRDAVANVVGTVKRDVNRSMAEWVRRFQLELPQDAREEITNRMVMLADKLIKVAIKSPEAFWEGEAA